MCWRVAALFNQVCTVNARMYPPGFSVQITLGFIRMITSSVLLVVAIAAFALWTIRYGGALPMPLVALEFETLNENLAANYEISFNKFWRDGLSLG